MDGVKRRVFKINRKFNLGDYNMLDISLEDEFHRGEGESDKDFDNRSMNEFIDRFIETCKDKRLL